MVIIILTIVLNVLYIKQFRERNNLSQVLDWPIRCIEWGIYSRTMNSWLTIKIGIITFDNSFPTQWDAEKFVTEKIGDRNAAQQMIEIRPKRIVPMNQYRPEDV